MRLGGGGNTHTVMNDELTPSVRPDVTEILLSEPLALSCVLLVSVSGPGPTARPPARGRPGVLCRRGRGRSAGFDASRVF